MSPPWGLSTLVKVLTVNTRVMQSSSNELSASISNSVKCKQKEVNTYTLNSLACSGAADCCGVILSDIKLDGFPSQQTLRQPH